MKANLGMMTMASKDWHKREIERFAKGKYKLVPWTQEAWFKASLLEVSDARAFHYVHVSEHDPWKLAYTPNEKDGEADRRVPIKPGRYLQKFFADVLTPEQIKHFAGTVRGSGLKVEITTNATMIKQVYAVQGLLACMSYSNDHYAVCRYNGNRHPTEVYANSDLALAFGMGVDGRIVGRSIVWPEKKIFSRCYGDHEAMTSALIAEGYTSGLLDGASFPLIKCDPKKVGREDQFTSPYIDHIKWARHDLEKGVLVLQSKATGATHSVQHSDGIAYPIAVAPGRPANATGETILGEWKRLCELEAGGTPKAPEFRPPPAAVIAPGRPTAFRIAADFQAERRQVEAARERIAQAQQGVAVNRDDPQVEAYNRAFNNVIAHAEVGIQDIAAVVDQRFWDALTGRRIV